MAENLTIGGRIRERREALKISRYAFRQLLSDQMGTNVAWSTVSAWERAKNPSTPGPEYIQAAAVVLKCQPGDLMGDDATAAPKPYPAPERPEPTMIREGTSAAQLAADPGHWLQDTLGMLGIVEPERIAAVCERIDRAAGLRGFDRSLARTVAELWLDSERLVSKRPASDQKAEAEARERKAKADKELAGKGLRKLPIPKSRKG